MFTGLVQATGEVVRFRPAEGVARLTISAPGIAQRLRLGDSVAVSGVCLTAIEIEPGPVARFSAELAAETIERTTLSRLMPGSTVNLELPTPAGSPLGGHLVQGHVDGTGRLVAIDPVSSPDEGNAKAATGSIATDWVVRLHLPEALMRYVVEKGSIAVDGISLTVAGVEGAEIWISILPHTYQATNLHRLALGAEVNIEVDVMAKYAEQMARVDAAKRDLTVESLMARGY